MKRIENVIRGIQKKVTFVQLFYTSSYLLVPVIWKEDNKPLFQTEINYRFRRKK